MSKLSFRARALDASKPMPVYLAEELPDLPEYSAINRAVPQMPSGMEKEEECEHHLQRAICTGLIIPTPEVTDAADLDFYERCYPPDYKMPKQLIHMQPLCLEQEAPEYDMDSDDERWLRQQRHDELTELKFEEMMDRLEKSSGQTVVALKEAMLLLERHDDLVIAVYDYWLNKRLKTQHPLILSVRTEHRAGQPANNPYLAFRRRTEKMQTRKNRKNDESSYEKMLKLRRDLSRAATLLEMVSRREKVKRDLVKLTALLAERRFLAGDFAGQMVAELTPQQPVRPAFAAISLPAQVPAYRREPAYIPHFTPRRPLTPLDQPRQREKRPYKRRKHRHHTTAATSLSLRDSGVYTSSEEETAAGEASSPPDDGPFAFRRKQGCYYQMPTSTLNGDFEEEQNNLATNMETPLHERDKKYRYTLTTIDHPYQRCVGFARRRLGRGGRVLLDRIATPLDDVWTNLNYNFTKSTKHKALKQQEKDFHTKWHTEPMEITKDYSETEKYPWRRVFRRHLNNNIHLWTKESVKSEVGSELNSEIPQKDIKNIGDISFNRSLDDLVIKNVNSVSRKRARRFSESSIDSDESLQPVEKEFSSLLDEVNKEWLHFRPKTPSPSKESPEELSDRIQVGLDTPISVELRLGVEEPPSKGLFDDTPFTTSEFTLSDLYPEPVTNADSLDASGSSVDITADDTALLNENFTGLTEAQVESILSETDLDELAKDTKTDLIEEIVKSDMKDPFLFHGQSTVDKILNSTGSGQKKKENFGSTTVRVVPLGDNLPFYIDKLPEDVKKPQKISKPSLKQEQVETKVVDKPQPVPTANLIVEEVNEVTPTKETVQITTKKRQETMEELQLTQGVQLKTIQTKHSPLKKHIITAAHRRPENVTLVATSQEATTSQPQIVTVAVSESLKVRLHNHLLNQQQGLVIDSSSLQTSGSNIMGLVQNGPFSVTNSAGVAVVPASVSLPTVSREGTVGVSIAGTSSPRRVTAPVVHLAPASLHQKNIQINQQNPLVVAHSHAIQQVASNKLKVLHAHALTQSQRQLLAQSRAAGLTQLPAVVSLSTLGDTKSTPTTALQLKATPGVTQFFEIKGGQLGKGTHLVNVVRQPQPGKPTVARLDLNDAKKRGQVVATFDGTALKGNIATATRPHRVSVSLEGRQIVRTALPTVRPNFRHQIQFKNARTLQVATPVRTMSEASTSLNTAKTTIPSSVVNLLQKNVAQIQKGGQKIAISAGQTLTANAQAIAAFTAAQQLKARQARLVVQPRQTVSAEIVEATSAPVAGSSGTSQTPREPGAEGEAPTNGAVRRRPTDTLPMEVT